MNICEDAPAIAQGRELQEAAPAPIFCFFMAFGMNLACFLRMVCQLNERAGSVLIWIISAFLQTWHATIQTLLFAHLDQPGAIA
jgi:hypothetical protein